LDSERIVGKPRPGSVDVTISPFHSKPLNERNRLVSLNTDRIRRERMHNMGQHKYREGSLKNKLPAFLGGVLIVSACVYAITYLPLGIVGAHGTAKMLAVGLVLMVAPIWAYIRKGRREY
jgi:hypothetical protein